MGGLEGLPPPRGGGAGASSSTDWYPSRPPEVNPPGIDQTEPTQLYEDWRNGLEGGL